MKQTKKRHLRNVTSAQRLFVRRTKAFAVLKNRNLKAEKLEEEEDEEDEEEDCRAGLVGVHVRRRASNELNRSIISLSTINAGVPPAHARANTQRP